MDQKLYCIYLIKLQSYVGQYFISQRNGNVPKLTYVSNSPLIMPSYFFCNIDNVENNFF